MASKSRHISASIDRPVDEVYYYASDPANVPAWAPGLATSVQQVDGQWVAESGMGRITIDFTGRNDYGVLDHRVTLPSGETVYNPMRVIADGSGSEVVFTLRQLPGVSDEEFERDTTLVQARPEQPQEGAGRRTLADMTSLAAALAVASDPIVRISYEITARAGEGARFAPGYALYDRDDGVVAWRAGSVDGFTADLQARRDGGRAVVFLTNTSPADRFLDVGAELLTLPA